MAKRAGLVSVDVCPPYRPLCILGTAVQLHVALGSWRRGFEGSEGRAGEMHWSPRGAEGWAGGLQFWGNVLRVPWGAPSRVGKDF